MKPFIKVYRRLDWETEKLWERKKVCSGRIMTVA
jgi:hypothetical protein